MNKEDAAALQDIIELSKDRSDEIRLSPSVAKVLLSQTPAHAYAYHSKLGGRKYKETPAKTKGKLIDRLVFGVGPAVFVSKGRGKDPEQICDAVDYEREAITVTDAAWKEASEVAASALAGMHDRSIIVAPHLTQQKWYWDAPNGTKCKGVLDLVNEDKTVIYDLKSAHDLADSALQYAIEAYGYDIQAAAYLEACKVLYGKEARFKWLFVETGDVNDFRVIEPDQRQLNYGLDKWIDACHSWQKCIDTDTWPGREDKVLGPSRFRNEKAKSQFEQEIK